MKLRAFLLVLLLAGGAYAMIQTMNEFSSKKFSEVLQMSENHVAQLIFTKPSSTGITPPAWVSSDKEQIANLLEFLSGYELQKKDSQQVLDELNFNQFTISLEDHDENLVTILVEDSLIVTHTGEQYTLLDGPFDTDWMINFILSNHSPS
ncbi:hypothetical protein DVB69_12310 [Sporosarcina sp. BI001-red]|uniref:hypothetical protein n=1 Tax=Sporosarcina sp. BI001-red TaxID=2282866 RepID=UPI000E24C054|nr:hypothetical protein [Sporosarcina sp. BI001-red]REB06483.1 hypothetical protein DVB69_12310 [Sporosarcina sp. BI001-red]